MPSYAELCRRSTLATTKAELSRVRLALSPVIATRLRVFSALRGFECSALVSTLTHAAYYHLSSMRSEALRVCPPGRPAWRVLVGARGVRVTLTVRRHSRAICMCASRRVASRPPPARAFAPRACPLLCAHVESTWTVERSRGDSPLATRDSCLLPPSSFRTRTRSIGLLLCKSRLHSERRSASDRVAVTL